MLPHRHLHILPVCMVESSIRDLYTYLEFLVVEIILFIKYLFVGISNNRKHVQAYRQHTPLPWSTSYAASLKKFQLQRKTAKMKWAC